MRLVARVAALAAVCVFVLSAPAAASPVATNDGSYQALGRVFPDPMAGCQKSAGTCSPYAQGNVPASQFIGIDEFVDAIKYMNSKPAWQRYMEIEALDGKLGDGAGSGKAPDIPGNNLSPEFTPNKDFASAGLPTTDLDRKKSDLMVIRVTDENVPDKGKKRYALSLSIHGIERAGAEGGIRAMEDLVTSHDTGLAAQKIVRDSIVKGAPTFDDVLKKSIIYFTLPNPDGWRRGSVSSGGVFFQRYNGNGVDPNRDWPDIGFAFRGYSAVSEPETKAWISYYGDVRKHGAFSAGDDLHGQPEADALSYTLLPHGRHLYDKNLRIQETAKAINRSTFDRISWSPIVQSNDQPRGGAAPCAPDAALGSACSKIYGQTWGSVYDTINYTTTGALGDWFDSAIGLHADGIDNEMSFSHLDKNITFDPHTEQLHVDGNKALIYAHLAQILTPQRTAVFDAGGRKAYVPNLRIKRAATTGQPTAPAGSVPQDDINSGPIPAAQSEFPFTVQRGQVGNKNVFSGGMRVEVTDSNIQGIGSGQVTLQVQCQHCDQHRGVKDDNEWVTVAEDYNQSFLYAQSGVVATVNNPQPFQANGRPVPWRVLVGGPTAAYVVKIHFTSGRASEDGNTGGDAPPEQRAYNVANTDFFKDLNRFMPGTSQDLKTLDPHKVIAGRQSLGALDTIALADDPLPGYIGELGGVSERGGPPTKDFTFDSTASAPGGGGCPSPANCEEKEFTIAPQDGNSQATVTVTWADGNNDFDLSVYAVDSAGKRTRIGRSAGGSPGRSEQVVLPDPNPGKYVIVVENFAAADPTWHGVAKFDALPSRPKTTYTQAQKNEWFLALTRWVKRGGTLVLTDGALRALPDLTNNEIPASAIARETVYAGQSAFSDGSKDTLNKALARNIAQPGARFNTGMRRQMFEPTPLGFAIQNEAGADGSYARQYDVDTAAWKKAGGDYVAGSADAGARDAEANYNKVTIGELKLGSGRIRIAGALLPQPTERYDHQFGLEPYATTYSGYVMARNLLDSINRAKRVAGSIGGRFVISGRRVKLKKGSRVVGVRVSCRTPLSCRGTLTLYLKRGKRLARIGTKSFFYRTKTPDTVLPVTVSSSAIRTLRTNRRTIVYASAPVKFRDGLKGVAKSRFPVYRP
jgi:hypothetical protein